MFNYLKIIIIVLFITSCSMQEDSNSDPIGNSNNTIQGLNTIGQPGQNEVEQSGQEEIAQ
jgi:PBP1b-binding outer membrane lipoprotein LpoB